MVVPSGLTAERAEIGQRADAADFQGSGLTCYYLARILKAGGNEASAQYWFNQATTLMQMSVEEIEKLLASA